MIGTIEGRPHMPHARNARLYNEWLEFHAANPQIYELFCSYVDKIIDRGFKKCSSTTIWGVMNFEAGTKRIPKSIAPITPTIGWNSILSTLNFSPSDRRPSAR
jgi:hypothetical protein